MKVPTRKIDVIVVYKVDRLTRSLVDFAKLVELFDAYGVSFVSVTQQFNTTTSMGLAHAQCAVDLCAVRTRGHLGADQGQDRSLQAQGPLGRRSPPPRLRHEGRQDCRRGA